MEEQIPNLINFLNITLDRLMLVQCSIKKVGIWMIKNMAGTESV